MSKNSLLSKEFRIYSREYRGNCEVAFIYVALIIFQGYLRWQEYQIFCDRWTLMSPILTITSPLISFGTLGLINFWFNQDVDINPFLIGLSYNLLLITAAIRRSVQLLLLSVALGAIPLLISPFVIYAKYRAHYSQFRAELHQKQEV